MAATRNGGTATREDLYEALSKVEEHLLYRYSIDAIYGKEDEVRTRVLEVVQRSAKTVAATEHRHEGANEPRGC